VSNKKKPRAAIAQILVKEGAFKANCKRGFDALQRAVHQGADIAILPELWTTGYRLEKAASQARRNRDILEEMGAFCKKNRIMCIAGSMILKNEKGKLVNRSVVFDKTGNPITIYDKMHLFPALGENHVFQRGERPAVFETPWGKAGLSLCYDLRFPELFRHYFLEGVKMIFLPSQWPYPRIRHWRTLVRARAVEDNCFIIACNIASRRGEKMLYGFSAVIDPAGEAVLELGHQEDVTTAPLDLGMAEEMNRLLNLRCNVHDFFKHR